MHRMKNATAVRRVVGRAAKRYDVQPGEVTEVFPQDVQALVHLGFVPVDDADPEPDTEPDQLDELTVAELRDLASERDLQGRSNMTKSELIAALDNPQE